MLVKLIITLFIISFSLNAKSSSDNNVTDLNTTKNFKDNNISDLNTTKYFTYINITSNTQNTKVYLDKKYIGTTPIELYKIPTDKHITLKANADKRYYPKDFIINIYAKKFTSPTYHIELEKGKAKILLSGRDGYLFINEAFNKTLHSNNRITEVEAGKNIKIDITNQDKRFSVVRDINASGFYELKYKLKPYRSTSKIKIIANLMWQDDDESKDKTLYYGKAKRYCEDLELAKYDDWYLPTIEQLENLYKDKKIFRSGFSTKFYWSSTPKSGKTNIWSYSQAKNFDDDTIQKKITDFYNGSVRCVRDIKSKK